MRIPCNTNSLNTIQHLKNWIPSGDQIRPLPETLEKKKKII